MAVPTHVKHSSRGLFWRNGHECAQFLYGHLDTKFSVFFRTTIRSRAYHSAKLYSTHFDHAHM